MAANARTDVRSYGDDNNRSRALAQQLVGLQPDIIVTATTAATVAVQRETWTIPIVFANVSDPVASGIVARLNQPGGNTTGAAIYEPSLGGKWLELLSDHGSLALGRLRPESELRRAERLRTLPTEL
jgi:putative ABC transport system substrate-binding protein